MNDYQKNIEVMAASIARMLAPVVALSEEDSLDVHSLELAAQNEITDKMMAEYRNEIEIDPLMVRTIGLKESYGKSLIREFDNSISGSCEQWIRRLQKDDRNEN